jgi:hypothetical protein
MTSNEIFDDILTKTRVDEADEADKALRVAAILWDAKKRTAEHFAKVGADTDKAEAAVAEAAVAEAAVAEAAVAETAVQPDTAATE